MYIADLDPDNPSTLAGEARVDYWDATFPDWDVRESYGVRYLSERDLRE